MSKKFTVSLGLNRGSRYSDGPACVTVPDAVSRVARLLSASGIVGATIVPVFGVWKGTLESSLQIQIVDADNSGILAEGVVAFVRLALPEFRQDAILVECENVAACVAASVDSFATVESEILRVEKEAR
jgi:hypothetical protein